MQFHVSFYDHKHDNAPKQSILSWDDLAELICKEPPVRATKDGQLFSAAKYKAGATRGNDGVEELSFLLLDFDKGEPTFAEVVERWQGSGYSFIAYTTYSFTREKEKFRLIVPLATPIPASEYEKLWLWVNRLEPMIDPTPKALASIFYLPAKPSRKAEYLWHIETGEWLDWRTLDLTAPSPKPRPPNPGQYVPVNGHDKRAESFFSSVIQRACQRVANAEEGTGNATLLKQGKLLGGWLHFGYFSEEDIVSQLKDSTAGWHKKQNIVSTIRRGINYGKAQPFYSIPDNPNWKATPQERLNQAAQDATDWEEQVKDINEGMEADAALKTTVRHQPEINVNDDENSVRVQSWQHLLKANDPPFLFQQYGQAVTIEKNDQGQPVIQPVTIARVRVELMKLIQFYKFNKDGDEITAKIPDKLPSDMLGHLPEELPLLRRVVRVPVFSKEGTLNTTPGYDAPSCCYYLPREGYTTRPVSTTPTKSEVFEALSLLYDDLLVDFPFVQRKVSAEGAQRVIEADRANAVALFFSPFIRAMINGVTPCYLIDSSANGSGKGLLAECLLYAAQDGWTAVTSELKGDEMEKMLFSMLLAGDLIILLDNINAKVSSGIFANYITARIKRGRILGKSQSLSVLVDTTWVITGSNVDMTNENARRMVHIRLVPKEANPENRTNFKHPFLRRWVEENSVNLAWAAHTLVQNWIAKGKPKPANSIAHGSFEEWYEVTAGILEAASIKDFMGNQDELNKTANSERSSWTEFIDDWYLHHEETSVLAAELLPKAEEFEIEIKGNNDKARSMAFSGLMKKQRDKRYAIKRTIEGQLTTLNIVVEHAARLPGGTAWRLRVIQKGE